MDPEDAFRPIRMSASLGFAGGLPIRADPGILSASTILAEQLGLIKWSGSSHSQTLEQAGTEKN